MFAFQFFHLRTPAHLNESLRASSNLFSRIPSFPPRDLVGNMKISSCEVVVIASLIGSIVYFVDSQSVTDNAGTTTVPATQATAVAPWNFEEDLTDALGGLVYRVLQKANSSIDGRYLSPRCKTALFQMSVGLKRKEIWALRSKYNSE